MKFILPLIIISLAAIEMVSVKGKDKNNILKQEKNITDNIIDSLLRNPSIAGNMPVMKAPNDIDYKIKIFNPPDSIDYKMNYFRVLPGIENFPFHTKPDKKKK